MQLNKGQLFALHELESGRNIFLTGFAGTGKTEVLRQYASEDKGVLLIAPTMQGAMNLNGKVLNRVLNIRQDRVLTPADMPSNEAHQQKTENLVKKEFTGVKSVVLDDISLVRADMFTAFVQAVQAAEEILNTDIQIVVCGDFFSLKPVIRKNDKAAFTASWGNNTYGFAFASEAWSNCDFENIVLDEPVRQSDPEFINALKSFTTGANASEYFNTNCYHDGAADPSGLCLVNGGKAADSRNKELIAAQTGKAYEFKAVSCVRKGFENSLSGNRWNLPETVVLHEGERVALLRNGRNEAEPFVNGSTGVITAIACPDETPSPETAKVTVKLDDSGKSVVLGGYVRHLYRSQAEADADRKAGTLDRSLPLKPRETASFTQIPLEPLYAVDFHRTVGMTLGSINVSRIFSSSDIYTALSRVHAPEDIHMEWKLAASDFQPVKEVKDFYANLETEEITAVPEKVSQEELDARNKVITERADAARNVLTAYAKLKSDTLPADAEPLTLNPAVACALTVERLDVYYDPEDPAVVIDNETGRRSVLVGVEKGEKPVISGKHTYDDVLACVWDADDQVIEAISYTDGLEDEQPEKLCEIDLKDEGKGA